MNSIYDKSTLIPPLCENELPQDLHALYHIFGMDSSRTDVIMLNEFEILYTAGNAVIQFNTLTKRRKYVIGIDGGGIGCIRLHSDRKHLFVGEQGTSPAIYVYTLPDYNIVKRLQGGTERGYACMDISIDGNKLCSVGMKPDYTMAVWDWKEEKIILRAKAFGQQIYRVAFSPYEDGRIVTSGSGHIRFWTMANTFTGLKLQGDIGKFGKADLSDIHAFVELPDGKVLSGSESGHLLLWEGRYIKCRFITEEKADNFNKEAEQESNKVGSKPAHEGGIFSIRHDIERNQIISAGADGSIRWWPAHIIDTAETDHDATIDFLITPDREYFIQKDLKINNVLAPPEKSSGEDDSSTLLVVDANCSIWRSTLSDDGVTEQEMECHCGEVVGLATSPMEHIAVTAGRDGSVRFWDYVCKSKIADMRFGCACSSLKWIPKEIDHKVRSIAVGFVDGTLRLLCLNGDELVLLKTIKPHDGEITSIDFSSYGEYTATSSMDGTISILQLGADSNGSFSASNIQPLGYIQSKEGAVAGISWAEQSLLYTTKSGKLVEIDISGQTNFEVHSVPDDFMLSLNQIICKSGISCAITLPAENRAQVPFLWGTIGSKFGGTIHCGILQGDEYIKTYHSGKNDAQEDSSKMITFLAMSSSKKFVVSGANDGSITLRSANQLSSFVKISMHNGHQRVTGAALSWDDAFILSTGSDGLLIVHRVKPNELIDASESNMQQRHYENTSKSEKSEENSSIHIFEDDGENVNDPPPGFEKITHTLDSTRDGTLICAQDVDGSCIFSFRQEKINENNKTREIAAEKAKENARETISELRKEYKEVLERNNSLPVDVRLTDEEMVIDTAYREKLLAKREHLLLEVQRERAYDSERIAMHLKKLQDKFINCLNYEHFTVKGLSNSIQVNSFVTEKLPPNPDKLPTIVSNEKFDESIVKTSTCDNPNDRVEEKVPPSDSPSKKRLSNYDKRKLMRASRVSEIDAMSLRRPTEDTDDPEDLQAIHNAKNNLGDYKIKSAKDYIPSGEDVSIKAKQSGVRKIEESLHALKCDFNQRLKQLRDDKHKAISDITKACDRVRFIDRKLGRDDLPQPWQPQPCPGEFPEHRGIVTEQDKDCYIKAAEKCEGDPIQEIKVLGYGSNTETSCNTSIDSPKLPLSKSDKHKEIENLSPLEIDEHQNEEVILLHERIQLFAQIDEKVDSIDCRLAKFRSERSKLQVTVSSGELKKLILAREIELLKKVEPKSNQLETMFDECKSERNKIFLEMTKCCDLLEEKKIQVKTWVDKEKRLMREFSLSVEEKSNFYLPLKQIFLENGTIESIICDSKDNDHSTKHSTKSARINCSIPPDGCDDKLHAHVLQLRDRRIQQENTLESLQKEIATLRAAYDECLSKEQRITGRLNKAETDLIEFRKQIFKLLSDQYVPTFISIDRIKVDQNYQESNDPPTGKTLAANDSANKTLNSQQCQPNAENVDCFIISQKAFSDLERRLPQLQEEIKNDKSGLRSMQRELAKLEKQISAKESTLKEQKELSRELQMLKFGQLIDMDALDNVESANAEAELEAEMNQLSKECNRDIAVVQKQQVELKEQYLGITNENTLILKEIAQVKARQLFLKREMQREKENRNDTRENSAQKQKSIYNYEEERKQLQSLVNIQAERIQNLKTEIKKLKRKDGHIDISAIQLLQSQL